MIGGGGSRPTTAFGLGSSDGPVDLGHFLSLDDNIGGRGRGFAAS